MHLKIAEETFEEKVINYLKRKPNFSYYNTERIMSLRNRSYSKVVLETILKNKVFQINSGVTEEIWNDVLYRVRALQDSDLIVANKEWYKIILEGIKIDDKKQKITRVIKVIDFNNWKNNDFIIANQVKVAAYHSPEKLKIPDIVLYLNGFPVVIFELKSPANSDEEIMQKAVEQLKTYQECSKQLFVFNFFNVISNKHINKLGTITSSFERYNFWKDHRANSKYKNKAWEYFLDHLFNPVNLFNLVKNYTFFTKEKKINKIIAAHHQFVGVEETKAQVLNCMNNTNPKNKKAGIFWHTQGTGKSFSMIFLIKNMIQQMHSATTLIVTDRNNLDEQLYTTFSKAENYLRQKITKFKNIKELNNELPLVRQNGIYFSTLHKFDKDKVLSYRNDILIIADEAHRSHRKGDDNLLSINRKEEIAAQKFSYAINLRKSFPNATFLGFTATPIIDKNYSTANVFGNYVSKYLLNEALEDEFIVPINYECRPKNLMLNETVMAELDIQEKKIRDRILNKSAVSDEIEKKYEHHLTKIENSIGDNDRIKAVVVDFLEHYKKRQNLVKGKALFVAYNRKIAYKYYREILKQNPEFEESLRIVITGRLSWVDPQDRKKTLQLGEIGSKEYNKKAAIDFKKPDSKLKIVIVVDMWLTGFDVPCLDIVYIDKLIQKHNLMQTIARVNRVYSDPTSNIVKNNGLVVDYIGIWKRLFEALKIYLLTDDLITPSPLMGVDIKEIRSLLQKKIKEIHKKCFSNKLIIDYEKLTKYDTHYWKTYVYDLNNQILEKLNTNKDVIPLFHTACKQLKKLFTATVSILNLKDKKETQLFLLTHQELIQQEKGEVDLAGNVQKVQKLIEDMIINNKLKVEHSYKKSIKLDLKTLHEEIMNAPLNSKYPLSNKIKLINLAKKMIEHLRKSNLIRGEKLSDKLAKIIQKYIKNFDQSIKIIDEKQFREIVLKPLADEIMSVEKVAVKLGLSSNELAFYEIIISNQYSKNNYDETILKKITQEIYTATKDKIFPGWRYNEAIKAEIRTRIKKILFDYDYPEEETNKLKFKLLQQLEDHILLSEQEHQI